MKNFKRFTLDWKVILSAGLIILSAAIYAIHYFLFRDIRSIFFYLVSEIAFIPINVLIVTFILHRLLESREKKARLKKLNMVIGAFFSEVGNTLISCFSSYDTNASGLRSTLIGHLESGTETSRIKKQVAEHGYDVEAQPQFFNHIKSFLAEKQVFLLGLLENPNLLEHESFSDLLWSVFHLTEELLHRKDMWQSSEPDLRHLQADTRRAYIKIVAEWLDYMMYLQKDYPYLYSLAKRLNPFDPDAKAEISET
jgi:hypothetical protein